MTRYLLAALAAWTLALAPAAPARAQAALPAAPDKMIEVLSNQVLDKIKGDPELRSGDLSRLSQFVDDTVMPYVNFERMTSLAVGRAWRTATPEQQKQRMGEFRALLLRTYAGAVSQVRDHVIRVKPLRAAPEDAEVIVRSEIVGTRGDPIQLDYRMEKNNPHWKIYDINVLGVWLVETYRNQFAQEINARGIDSLIKVLGDRNRQFSQQGGKS
jgi:phospholipid transport system substrate-binding protein